METALSVEEVAINASNGCVASRNLLMKISLSRINRATMKNWYKIEDETSFLMRSIRNVDCLLRTFDPKKGSYNGLVTKAINQALYTAISKSKMFQKRIDDVPRSESERSYLFDSIEDDLAVVDDNYLVNERIASLAGDDSRRKFTLKAWSEGYFNDSELAALLAQRFGGNVERHRKFIRRFRAECQEKLLETA